MDADMPPEAVKPLEAPGRAGDLQGEPAHQPAGVGKKRDYKTRGRGQRPLSFKNDSPGGSWT